MFIFTSTWPHFNAAIVAYIYSTHSNFYSHWTIQFARRKLAPIYYYCHLWIITMHNKRKFVIIAFKLTDAEHIKYYELFDFLLFVNLCFDDYCIRMESRFPYNIQVTPTDWHSLFICVKYEALVWSHRRKTSLVAANFFFRWFFTVFVSIIR